MKQIKQQEELDAVLREINANGGGGTIREVHVISPSYFITVDEKVYETSGNGGYLARLLICLPEGEHGAVEFIFEGVGRVNLPSGAELEMSGDVCDFNVSIQFTENPDDGYIYGRKLYIEYHDRSVWGSQAYYVPHNPLDEDGFLDVDNIHNYGTVPPNGDCDD